MIRELKFRAWDKKKRKMVYFTFKDIHTMMLSSSENLYVTNLGELSDKHGVGKRYYDRTDINIKDFGDKVEVTQFTGLKDKNGKEIYDGDVLKGGETKGNIEIHEVKIVVGSSGVVLDYGYPRKHNYPCDNWMEIIGNKFEDKKLLK